MHAPWCTGGEDFCTDYVLQNRMNVAEGTIKKMRIAIAKTCLLLEKTSAKFISGGLWFNQFAAVPYPARRRRQPYPAIPAMPMPSSVRLAGSGAELGGAEETVKVPSTSRKLPRALLP